MRQLKCTITMLLFAAHAVLGCCAHHAHGFGFASETESLAVQADHDCGHHHDGTVPQPLGSDHHSPRPCSQGTCSFLKAESPRLTHDNGHVLAVVATVPVITPPAVTAATIAHAVPIVADPFSAQLYLCFCALVI